MNNKAELFFSFLVPNYGFKELIFECLSSLLKQKNINEINYEVLVCDQSEYNDFNRIISETKLRFGKDANRIKYIHSKIKGVLKARHMLISQAKGKYVVFVDSDDFVSQDYLESIYCSLAKNNFPDMLIHTYRICDFDGKNEVSLDEIEPNEKNVLDLFVYSSKLNSIIRKCFKRTLYNVNDYDDFETENGDDWVFSYPLIMKSKGIIFDYSINGYFYRKNPQSMTHNFTYENGLKQLFYRKNTVEKFKPTTNFQSSLFLENELSTYVGVMIHFLKNKTANFSQVISISKKFRLYIFNVDKIRYKRELKFSLRLIYFLLSIKFYIMIYMLLKFRSVRKR